MYFGDFKDKEDVFRQFEVSNTEGINIIAASYDVNGYDGQAAVIFEKDGKFYETYGSHCSCYGLDGQWEPEEILVDELRNRIDNGRFAQSYGEPFAECVARGVLTHIFEKEVIAPE